MRPTPCRCEVPACPWAADDPESAISPTAVLRIISPSPSVALRVCSGHLFAYELLTLSVVALVRSRGLSCRLRALLAVDRLPRVSKAGLQSKVQSFPLCLLPQSSARFAPRKVQFLSERKKSGSSRDSAWLQLRYRAQEFCMTYVPGAPNASPGDSQGSGEPFPCRERQPRHRGIPITPDLDFRWSVFAGHGNIFPCSKAVSISPSPSAPWLYRKNYRATDCTGDAALAHLPMPHHQRE